MKLKSLVIPIIALSLFTPRAESSNKIFYLDENPSTRTETVRGLHTPPELILPLYQMTKDVSEVLEKHGINYWAAFGTLLGATRHNCNGRLPGGGIIPWDDDADLCFDKNDEGKLTSPLLKEELLALGYDLSADDLVGYKVKSIALIVNPKTQKEVQLFVDLFTTELQEGRYILSREWARNTFRNGWYTQEQVQNKSKVKFGGFELYAPTDAQTYLLRNHGEGWATIGHYYQAHHIDSEDKKYIWTLSRRDLTPAQPTGPLLHRVKENYSATNKVFWNKFYATTSLAREPSSFCSFLLEKGIICQGSTLVDIGCGNGRDTFAFRNKGINAIGIDSSEAAVTTNLGYCELQGLPTDMFRVVDVTAEGAMVDYTGFDYIYARFFIHALTEDQQRVFEQFLSQVKVGGRLLLEFRTDKDPLYNLSTKISGTEGKTDHYRRYINFQGFCEALVSLNYEISLAVEQDNLSVAYKDDPRLGRIMDNPVLGRIVATKIEGN